MGCAYLFRRVEKGERTKFNMLSLQSVNNTRALWYDSTRNITRLHMIDHKGTHTQWNCTPDTILVLSISGRAPCPWYNHCTVNQELGAVVNCLPGSGFKHCQITPSMSCPVADLWRESEACVKFMPSSWVRQTEWGLYNRKNQPKYGDVQITCYE